MLIVKVIDFGKASATSCGQVRQAAHYKMLYLAGLCCIDNVSTCLELMLHVVFGIDGSARNSVLGNGKDAVCILEG
jgi:hypothetical protein